MSTVVSFAAVIATVFTKEEIARFVRDFLKIQESFKGPEYCIAGSAPLALALAKKGAPNVFLPNDIDVFTSLTPEEIAKRFPDVKFSNQYYFKTSKLKTGSLVMNVGDQSYKIQFVMVPSCTNLMSFCEQDFDLDCACVYWQNGGLVLGVRGAGAVSNMTVQVLAGRRAKMSRMLRYSRRGFTISYDRANPPEFEKFDIVAPTDLELLEHIASDARQIRHVMLKGFSTEQLLAQCAELDKSGTTGCYTRMMHSAIVTDSTITSSAVFKHFIRFEHCTFDIREAVPGIGHLLFKRCTGHLTLDALYGLYVDCMRCNGLVIDDVVMRPNVTNSSAGIYTIQKSTNVVVAFRNSTITDGTRVSFQQSTGMTIDAALVEGFFATIYVVTKMNDTSNPLEHLRVTRPGRARDPLVPHGYATKIVARGGCRVRCFGRYESNSRFNDSEIAMTYTSATDFTDFLTNVLNGAFAEIEVLLAQRPSWVDPHKLHTNKRYTGTDLMVELLALIKNRPVRDLAVHMARLGPVAISAERDAELIFGSVEAAKARKIANAGYATASPAADAALSETVQLALAQHAAFVPTERLSGRARLAEAAPAAAAAAPAAATAVEAAEHSAALLRREMEGLMAESRVVPGYISDVVATALQCGTSPAPMSRSSHHSFAADLSERADRIAQRARELAAAATFATCPREAGEEEPLLSATGWVHCD